MRDVNEKPIFMKCKCLFQLSPNKLIHLDFNVVMAWHLARMQIDRSAKKTLKWKEHQKDRKEDLSRYDIERKCAAS